MVALIELVGLALASASLFGLIVGLFSIYNGRATRQLILQEERRTQEILDRVDETLSGVKKLAEGNNEALKRSAETLNRVGETLGDMKKLAEGNNEVLKRSIEILDRNTAILDRISTKLLSA